MLHNFYVPAGGDIPDPALNPKFEHKLQFLDEMKACEPLHPRGDDRHILVGDLNVAPHEHDVWSHKQLLKVVSHTPIECEKLLAAQAHGEWFDVARERIPLSEKVYTWWSYRAADWTVGDRGRRLDHIWVSRALKDSVTRFPHHPRRARLGAAVGSCAGDGGVGGREATYCRHSGERAQRRARNRRRGRHHVLSFAPAIRISLASWLVRVASSSRRRRAAAGSLSSTR